MCDLALQCSECTDVFDGVDHINQINIREKGYRFYEGYELRKDACSIGWSVTIEHKTIGNVIYSDIIIDRCPSCVKRHRDRLREHK